MMESNESVILEQSAQIKLKDLTISAKGKFKWSGNFQGLQEMINQQLGLQTKWSTPGGDAKKFENDKLVIRWYPESSSLTIKGTDSSTLKGKLAIIANEDLEKTDLEMNCEHEAFTDNEIKHGDDEITKAGQLQPNGENSVEMQDEADENDEIKKYIQQLENKMEAKFKELSNDMRSLKTTTELVNEIRSARNINQTLKLEEENYALKEKINNQSYLISELSSKVKDLENERSSLLTVVRILQTEADNTQEWKTVGPRRRIRPEKSYCEYANTNKVGKSHKTNRYEILSDSTDADDAVLVHRMKKNAEENAKLNKQVLYEKPNNALTKDKQEQPNRNEHHKASNDTDTEPTVEEQNSPYNRSITSHKNTRNKEPTFDKPSITNSATKNSYSKSKTTEGPITILGDSMIKMIKPHKLSRSIGEKINIKTFPGATINDMTHYIQPTMKKQPKLVVLHVGTNDVQQKEPEGIVAEMKSLCQGIVSQSLSKIAISEIIKRQDPAINIKIDRINSLLAKLCSKYKWQFIQHTNVDASKLNASGLHLNSQGTAMLAKNFIEFLKN